MGIRQPNPAAANDYHDNGDGRADWRPLAEAVFSTPDCLAASPDAANSINWLPVLRPGTGLPLRNFDTLRPRAP